MLESPTICEAPQVATRRPPNNQQMPRTALGPIQGLSFGILFLGAACWPPQIVNGNPSQMPMPRTNFDESCSVLRQRGLLGTDEFPRLPDRMPCFDDEQLTGVRFFRTLVQANPGLENLTLRRTFFGRSEVSKISFRNTDLSESNGCWNDFIDVDFSCACLTNCDMRASQFISVNFSGADIGGADLRHSSFKKCVFDGASLDAAILTHAQGKLLSLSSAQRQMIAWHIEPGDEPGGG